MTQSTRDEVNSLQHFQQHSRLHFIGQWRTKMEDEFREWFVTHPEWNHGTLEQQRTYVHVDMDAFFCSVQLAKPEYAHLKNSPVGIAAGKFNSDISSCNYVARSYGIHAGMYVNAARERCPELVTLGYDLKMSEHVAKTLYRIIFDSFPPSVKMSMEVYSIDEAMLATDTTDYSLLQSFCENVRKELFSSTGCTASCGIGPNIMLARLATDRCKPDGICVIQAEDVRHVVSVLPLEQVHGAGETTMERICRVLREEGIINTNTDASDVTCGFVQKLALEVLQRTLGKKQGETFYHLVRGEDSRVVTRTGDPDDQRHLGKRVPSALGCSMNYGVRPHGVEDVWRIARQLLDDVCGKLRRTNTAAQSLRVTLLERHPLHPKETQKYMGRGKCVEVHLPIKLSHAMVADEVEAMEREIQQVVAPLLVTSRAISDEERAAQLHLSCGKINPVIWTVTLACLRDIVVQDLRGMTIQATGLRPMEDAPRLRQHVTGQQMTLAASFSNAKRPRVDDTVTVIEPTPAQCLSQTTHRPSPEGRSAAATLLLLYNQPWSASDKAKIADWCGGCESACNQLDYPVVKAYLRCALAKLSEWPVPREAAECFHRLLSFANNHLPAPLDFS